MNLNQLQKLIGTQKLQIKRAESEVDHRGELQATLTDSEFTLQRTNDHYLVQLEVLSLSWEKHQCNSDNSVLIGRYTSCN